MVDLRTQSLAALVAVMVGVTLTAVAGLWLLGLLHEQGSRGGLFVIAVLAFATTGVVASRSRLRRS